MNIPLMYGVGARAFIRLQEVIAAQSNGTGLIAWEASTN
jgi:hypothetical protein